MDQLFIGSDRMVTAEFLEAAGKGVVKVVAGYPYDPESRDPKHVEFIEQFNARFGEPPETYAAHAYDGMAQLIDAIERGGLNRALIRDEMMAVKTWHGVTGHKTYDAICSNRSPAVLAVVEDGAWTFR
ncbi:MAG: ABC transporter substrate-binding protein [Acidobacteria bacterium]|nr:ABC transporter substrate-binding protein [Candidatus Sulfomarinibacter kjeldsenii]